MDKNLADLMEKAQGGDATAYNNLLTQARPMILGFLKNRLRNDAVADDLCQDVLLRIHAFRHTFQPGKPFEPWMYSVTRNTMIDYIRSQKRKGQQVALPLEEMLGSEGNDAEAKIALENALSALTPEQQEAIELTKIDGLSVQDAAKKAGISESALKVRTHRAVKVIKDNLKKVD